jgi:hypothetical protein
LYRELKELIASLGANQHPGAIEKIGKCLGSLQDISSHFLLSVNNSVDPGRHSRPANKKDVQIMTEILAQTCKVCTLTQNRTLPGRKKYRSIVDGERKEDCAKWLKTIMKEAVVF